MKRPAKRNGQQQNRNEGEQQALHVGLMEVVENTGIPVEEHNAQNKHKNLKDDRHEQIRRVLDQRNALRFAVQPRQNL